MIDPSLISPPVSATTPSGSVAQFEVLSSFYSYLGGLESEVLLGRFPTEGAAWSFRHSLPRSDDSCLRVVVRPVEVAPIMPDPADFRLVHGHEFDISFKNGEATLETFHHTAATEILSVETQVVRSLLNTPGHLLVTLADDPNALPSDFQDSILDAPAGIPVRTDASYVRVFSLEPIEAQDAKILVKDLFELLIQAIRDHSPVTSEPASAAGETN